MRTVDDDAALETLTDAANLQRAILLANPLLDFDLVVARETNNLGLTANYHSNSNLRREGYNNRIMKFSIHGNTPDRTVFAPEKTRFVGDFCLHWDADRMLFSMPTDQDWQVFEIRLDGTGLRQISPEIENGINNYDAAYLPNGDVLFTSTLPMVSVPCVAGGAHVANLVRLHADGSVRQLCFDQEHNWHPRVLPNGTVLYQRWEYTDTPHANTRLLMTMNPDGTNQRAFYGSNSYWPTAFFYATPVPGSSTRVAGISSGHHGDRRLGELIILDAARGSHEASGVVQPIPSTATHNIGRIYDHMRNVWPRFLHPQPLSENYFLVACQPTPQHRWGVYLVDVFDNFLLLKDDPALAVVEPMPVVRRPVPPIENPVIELAGWPFDADASPAPPLEVDGYVIEMMHIPAGAFVMGNPDGHRDEQPVARVVIDKPFQMARYEVTNELYRKFNPNHVTSSHRLVYDDYQPVMWVGFRIMIEE